MIIQAIVISRNKNHKFMRSDELFNQLSFNGTKSSISLFN